MLWHNGVKSYLKEHFYFLRLFLPFLFVCNVNAQKHLMKVHQNKDATSKMILQYCVGLSKMVQVVRCASADRQIIVRRHYLKVNFKTKQRYKII